MMDLTRRHVLLAPGAALLQAACGDALTKPFPDRRLFTLDVRRPQRRPPPATGPVLLVRRFQAGPGAEEQGLLSRTEPQTLRQDFYNQFLTPPSLLVEEATRRWMGDTGLFREVVLPGSRLEPTHAVEGTLVALYGDFTGPQPVSIVDLGLLVLDVRTVQTAIVHQGSYRRETPVAAPTPEALVMGHTQGLAAILTEVETALQGRLRA